MKALWLAAAILILLLPEGAPLRAATAERVPVRTGLPRGTAGNAFQRGSLEKLIHGASRAVDSLDVIVFRVSFADRTFGAQHDSLYCQNELRHLTEYYLGASRNVFHLNAELAPAIISLSGNEAYYGDDALWKERMGEILIELVQKTDSYIDFSRYDAVAVIHADAGQETDFNGDSPGQLWSGFVDPREMAEALKDTLGTPGVPTNDTVNGDTISVDNLMVWPEESSQDGYTFGSLGIYAYQLGLRLGMIPLQDTTPGNFPDSQGIGQFDLMGYGIYNGAFQAKDYKILLSLVPAFPSAFNRYLMGWVAPVVLDGDCTARIVDINTAGSADTALIKIPISPSEYFLIENRVHDTNFNGKFDFIEGNHDSIDYVGNAIPENEDTLRGAEFDFFLTETTDLLVSGDSLRITGSGLMIYHVDESVIRRAIESGGYPNDDAMWKGVDIEEADGIQDLDGPGGAFAFGSFYDSFQKGNNDRFGTHTSPSSMSNGGAETGIELDEISAPGHFMTFRARFSPPMDFKRGEFAGDCGRLSPIPADIDDDGLEELVIAADTGLIYIAPGAGSEDWTGQVAKIAGIEGALWSGPPVLGDIDSDGVLEIFITSQDGTLHALEPTGVPYGIDTDLTPGTLKLRGDNASAPIALELDGDPGTEIVVFSSTADSTYACFIGYSGTWPGTGGIRRGSDGMEMKLGPGRLVSHPAFGVLHEEGKEVEGLYFVTSHSGSVLEFHYLRLLDNGSFVGWMGSYISLLLTFKETIEGFMTLAAGDLDGDGSDDLVALIPARANSPGSNEMLYWAPLGPVHFAPVRGSHASSPVLADVDGDGTLETALRDEKYLYLLSGFGTPVSGWPKALEDAIVEHDRGTYPAPPVVGDVDGDGQIEVLYRVAGTLHAFDFYGREISGWPLPGEGGAGGSTALLKGEGNGLYLFDSAAFLPYSIDSTLGGEAEETVSSVRRYDPKCAFPDGQIWPCYRHGADGSSRQLRSAGASPRETWIDPSSFIVYPNPATGPSVTIRILISAPAEVRLKVLNVEGEIVLERTRSHPWFEGSAVPFEETIDTKSFSSGVYIARIEIAGSSWSWNGSKKFAVIR